MAANQSPSPLAKFWLLAGLVIIIVLTVILFQDRQTSTSDVPAQQQIFNFNNQLLTFDQGTLYFVDNKYTGADAEAGHTAEIIQQATNPAGNRAAAIVADSPGGSGTFFYVIGAMPVNGEIVYSTAMPLGDRIEVTSLSVEDPAEHNNGVITVEYLDRPANAPMATSPTIPTTARFAFEDNGELIAVKE